MDSMWLTKVGDKCLLETLPKDFLILVLSALVPYLVVKTQKALKDWQKIEKLWRDHFPLLIEGETQRVVGMRKARTLPDFTLMTAGRIVFPTWKQLLEYCWRGSFVHKLVLEIETKRNVSHIIHGGPVVSDLSELAIFEYEHSIDFGYAIGKDIVYEVTPDDYRKAGETEVTSKEWLIVDKASKKPLVQPQRKKDGTYYSDGAIVLRIEDPYREASTETAKTDLLAFCGTHAPGSYASNALVRVPEWVEVFEKKLHDSHIHGDPFIAAVEIKFEPYEFGVPPGDEKIREIDIKSIEKLTKRRQPK